MTERTFLSWTRVTKVVAEFANTLALFDRIHMSLKAFEEVATLVNHRQVNAQRIEDIEARRRAREELHRVPGNQSTPTCASASGSPSGQGVKVPDIVMTHSGNNMSNLMKHLIRLARPERREEVIQEVLQDGGGVSLDLTPGGVEECLRLRGHPGQRCRR